MEVLACRTSKINSIFIAAMAVLVPKYIYGQYLCEKSKCRQSNVEVVACRI